MRELKASIQLYRAKSLTVRLTGACFLLLALLGCGGGAGTSNSPIAAATLSSAVTFAPVNGSAAVSTSATVSITFNAALDASTINDQTVQVTCPDGAISGTVTYDGAKTVTFTPNAPLLPWTTYTAVIRGSIRYSTGQTLSTDFTSNFTTGTDALARVSAQAISATFFGQHIHHADTTTVWPAISFGTWRLWDAHVAWPWLEPAKGNWNFSKLDTYVALAESHNVDVILPLALSPTWASARPTENSAYGAGNAAEPANITDWTDYVQTVANRYKGRIHYYEIWNEPNLAMFYTGSVPKMIELVKAAYQTVKAIDPSAQIISPSATGSGGVTWLDNYLAQGGTDYSDIVGFHLYVTPSAPEAMVNLATQVKAVMAKANAYNKPLWNTESGWYIQNSDNSVVGTDNFSKVLNTSDAAAYIARAYILNWASGVDRFYWYAWDNLNMGFVEKDQTIKSSSAAFTQTFNWLNQSTMVSCGKDSQGDWVTKLVKNNGRVAWIIWNPDKTTTITVPTEWNATQVTDLTGKISPVNVQLTVGPAPLFVQS